MGKVIYMQSLQTAAMSFRQQLHLRQRAAFNPGFQVAVPAGFLKNMADDVPSLVRINDRRRLGALVC